MIKLVRETSLLTISNVLTRVVALLFWVVLARSVSISDFGLFRYLATISVIYGFLFAGIPTALTKFVGEDSRDRGKISEYHTASLAVMIMLFLFLTAIILIFDSNKGLLILLLFAFLVDSHYLGLVRGLLNYTKLAGYKLLENIIQLAVLLISYIIFKHVSLTYAVVFFSLSGLVSATIFEMIAPEFTVLKSISKEKVAQMIKYAIPVTLGMIGWTVMFGINTIFIERFYGSEAVAYYSVGLTIVQVFAFFPEAIVTIMMPRVASIKDVSRIRQRLNQAVLATLVVSVVILAPLMIFKGRIVTIMFTEKYLAGVATILPLALGQIAISVYQIYGAVWQGLGKPGIPSLTISIAATLNVGGSYFLTKLSGINGAALSLAVTSVLALIIMYGFWTRWKRNLASSLKPSPGMVDASK